MAPAHTIDTMTLAELRRLARDQAASLDTMAGRQAAASDDDGRQAASRVADTLAHDLMQCEERGAELEQQLSTQALALDTALEDLQRRESQLATLSEESARNVATGLDTSSDVAHDDDSGERENELDASTEDDAQPRDIVAQGEKGEAPPYPHPATARVAPHSRTIPTAATQKTPCPHCNTAATFLKRALKLCGIWARASASQNSGNHRLTTALKREVASLELTLEEANG